MKQYFLCLFLNKEYEKIKDSSLQCTDERKKKFVSLFHEEHVKHTTFPFPCSVFWNS